VRTARERALGRADGDGMRCSYQEWRSRSPLASTLVRCQRNCSRQEFGRSPPGGGVHSAFAGSEFREHPGRHRPLPKRHWCPRPSTGKRRHHRSYAAYGRLQEAIRYRRRIGGRGVCEFAASWLAAFGRRQGPLHWVSSAVGPTGIQSTGCRLSSAASRGVLISCRNALNPGGSSVFGAPALDRSHGTRAPAC
jgi:hypothetical protein